MATEASKIPFVEAAAPATPAAGRVTIYSKIDGLMYSKDDAGTETLMSSGGVGSVATDVIWDAAGDLVQGTGANTAAKLASGADGTVLTGAGVGTAVAWEYPPGYRMDYAAITTGVTVASTTPGTGTTIVNGASVTYANIPYRVKFFSPSVNTPLATNGFVGIELYVDGTVVGTIGVVLSVLNTAAIRAPVNLEYIWTPSAGAHTVSIRAFRDTTGTGTAVVAAGASGSNVLVAAFVEVLKV